MCAIKNDKDNILLGSGAETFQMKNIIGIQNTWLLNYFI